MQPDGLAQDRLGPVLSGPVLSRPLPQRLPRQPAVGGPTLIQTVDTHGFQPRTFAIDKVAACW